MILYYSNALNIEGLLELNPPTNIDYFQKERLIYILSLLKSIPYNKEDSMTDDDFVMIKSVYLRKVIPNYKQYFTYLLNNNILKCDNYFKEGVKCKGYKYCPPYDSIAEQEFVVSKTFKKHIENSYEGSRIDLRKVRSGKYNSITKWHNHLLRIDADLACEFNKADRLRKWDKPELQEKKKKKGKKVTTKIRKPGLLEGRKDPDIQYDSANQIIRTIELASLYPSNKTNLTMDKTSFRVHTPITKLNKKFRPLLSYDDLPLVCIDITNSQPYLATVLFKRDFYYTKKSQSVFNIGYLDKKQIDNIFGLSAKKKINFNTHNSRGVYNIIPDVYTLITLPPTCFKTAKTQYSNDFQRFKEFAFSGEFYEKLAKIIPLEGGGNYDRDDIKPIVFEVLFSGINYSSQQKKAFAKAFPKIYKLFNKIKSHKKGHLAILLQMIESFLMIEKVVKRIYHERPDLPIFTIHDSVATTVGNEDYVATVIKEEFGKAIGNEPQLTVDYWSPEKLAFKDKLLYSEYISNNTTHQGIAA